MASMNQPDRIKSWVLESDEKGMLITEDPKLTNAITIIFKKQDHTLGNMLRAQLLLSPSVLFAGYRVPHPLVNDLELRLQTDSSVTPRKALYDACVSLAATTGELKRQWEMEVGRVELVQGAGGVGAAGGMGAGEGERDPYADTY